MKFYNIISFDDATSAVTFLAMCTIYMRGLPSSSSQKPEVLSYSAAAE